jgi:hypothetical protein
MGWWAWLPSCLGSRHHRRRRSVTATATATMQRQMCATATPSYPTMPYHSLWAACMCGSLHNSVSALYVYLIITTSIFINIMKNRHMFGTACIPQFSYRQEDSMNAYSIRISEELCRCSNHRRVSLYYSLVQMVCWRTQGCILVRAKRPYVQFEAARVTSTEIRSRGYKLAREGWDPKSLVKVKWS